MSIPCFLALFPRPMSLFISFLPGFVYYRLNSYKILLSDIKKLPDRYDGSDYLQTALFFQNFEIVPTLIPLINDINKQGLEGDTALHFAAMGGDYESIKLLLESGADKKIISIDGLTAYDVYVEEHEIQKDEILELLKVEDF
jgi:hypothetical protein